MSGANIPSGDPLSSTMALLRNCTVSFTKYGKHKVEKFFKENSTEQAGPLPTHHFLLLKFKDAIQTEV